MDNLYDYQKFAILYVDDEEMSLKYFARAFRDKFRILVAVDAPAGYQLLEQYGDEIGLLITDQRMPGEKGVEFLERARQLHPRAIRILTTAYSDLDVAIEAVNSGAIYKYVTKPWDIPELGVTLQRALEFYMVQRERDLLLKEKLSALQRMLITDRVLSLGILAARLGHQVRNSLVAVRTFLDLAPEKLIEENIDAERMHNPNFWKEFYELTQAQIRRITELLTDLVVATEKSDSLVLHEVQLDETVARTLENLKNRLSESSITVVNQIPAGLPSLTAEPRKFQRLFDLLLKDEIISLPPGSRIFITGCAGTGAAGEEVQIEIRDDGPGLPKEALRAIFDPFFLRAETYPDFGINLLACYFIVYHLGGSVHAQSQAGRGVTFTLRFPIQPAETSPAEEEEAFISKVLVNDAFWERMVAGY